MTCPRKRWNQENLQHPALRLVNRRTRSGNGTTANPLRCPSVFRLFASSMPPGNLQPRKSTCLSRAKSLQVDAKVRLQEENKTNHVPRFARLAIPTATCGRPCRRLLAACAPAPPVRLQPGALRSSLARPLPPSVHQGGRTKSDAKKSAGSTWTPRPCGRASLVFPRATCAPLSSCLSRRLASSAPRREFSES